MIITEIYEKDFLKLSLNLFEKVRKAVKKDQNRMKPTEVTVDCDAQEIIRNARISVGSNGSDFPTVAVFIHKPKSQNDEGFYLDKYCRVSPANFVYFCGVRHIYQDRNYFYPRSDISWETVRKRETEKAYLVHLDESKIQYDEQAKKKRAFMKANITKKRYIILSYGKKGQERIYEAYNFDNADELDEKYNELCERLNTEAEENRDDHFTACLEVQNGQREMTTSFISQADKVEPAIE